MKGEAPTGKASAECEECGGCGRLAIHDADGMERGNFACPSCSGTGVAGVRLSALQIALLEEGWWFEHLEGTVAWMQSPGDGVHMWVAADGSRSFGRPS